MTAVIRAESLTKFYGASRGVVDLGFEVEAGEVFGFLGPNGAGKTTTIRLMLDLILGLGRAARPAACPPATPHPPTGRNTVARKTRPNVPTLRQISTR